ncbi:MAG: PAS domain S-box protein [Anaerolineales bacterium]|uniref:PAS domain S-box protein n=1 Tax=Candidatus Villigracilis proximus TaxID=3140683 RepID=UPI0031360F78|nr:PAS domain S-box protein [Anaerolineales bacterium]
MSGQSVLIVHPPEQREEAGKIVAEILAGRAEYCPVPVMTRGGVQIPVETRVALGKWSGQDVIFGITKDISEIKASEEKFSKAFHASPASMAISDIQTGVYYDINDTFLNTMGYSREEIIGKVLFAEYYRAREARRDAGNAESKADRTQLRRRCADQVRRNTQWVILH